MTRTVTQLGHLPFRDIKEAVDYSRRHEIPFLPELGRLGDNMMDYLLHPGRLSCLDEFKKYEYDTVKIQCFGPATAAQIPELNLSLDELTANIYEHISIILDGLKARKILLFLDEPTVGLAGFNYYDAWDAIFGSFGAEAGVHCCWIADWDLLFKYPQMRYVSFDAGQYGEAFTKYPAYEDYRSRGGKIAWSISSISEVQDFREGDLLTLPCAEGIYPVAACDSRLLALGQAADYFNSTISRDVSSPPDIQLQNAAEQALEGVRLGVSLSGSHYQGLTKEA